MKHATYKYFAALVIAMQLCISGCAKVKEKSEMTLDELKTRATTHLKNHEYEDAAEYLQMVITKFPENPKLGHYKISLANCKFNHQDYESAFQLYENFHQYYPSDSRAEYAKYKAAMCKHRQSLEHDRDQTATEATIRACNAYQEIPTYQKYRAEIDTMRTNCTQKLIDKELYVCKFYIKHGKVQAAEKRLEQARKLYGTNKDLDAQFLYLECKLAGKTNNSDVFKEKLNNLTLQYPASPFTALAENLVQKPSDFVF